MAVEFLTSSAGAVGGIWLGAEAVGCSPRSFMGTATQPTQCVPLQAAVGVVGGGTIGSVAGARLAARWTGSEHSIWGNFAGAAGGILVGAVLHDWIFVRPDSGPEARLRPLLTMALTQGAFTVLMGRLLARDER